MSINPSSPAFTLQRRNRSRSSAGIVVVDTYAGPTADLATFLASYPYGTAHSVNTSSLLSSIREDYDDSRQMVYVELNYEPSTAGYGFRSMRPVGTTIIEAEPITEEVPMSSISTADADYDASKDTLSRPAVQVAVTTTEAAFNWTEAELKSKSTGAATPSAYFAAGATFTAAAWAAAGCRIRESDGTAEITRTWIFKPRLAP